MEVERDEQIRKLAYQIWQQEGHPHGNEIQHWLKAEALWLEEHRAKEAPKQPKTVKRAKRKKTTDLRREL
jgi:hypothetical protein